MPSVTIENSGSSERPKPEDVEEATEWFVNDQSQMMVRVRECLEEKGVHVGKNALVVEFFADATDFEWGLIVTEDQKVFNFGYDYYQKKDFEGELSLWEDRTNDWQELALSSYVAAGLKFYEERT